MDERGKKGSDSGLKSADKGEDVFLGRTLADKYKIIEKLGGGGMGAVYLAEHLALKRDVAVKVLHPHLVSDQEHLARFQTEARTAFSLKHPNIITLHDFGVDGEYPYLVMEFIKGRTLKQLLRSEENFELDRVYSVTRQVLSALSVAHRRGVVHRDLKPDNIMIALDADGVEEAYVLDFGIAKVINSSTEADLVQTQAGIVFGSPQYLAPEQVLEKPIDPRTDLYALGSILYEVIGGQKTFPSANPMASIFQRVNEDPTPLKKIKTDVRPELNNFVMKLLARDRDDRYESADACLEELEYAFLGAREASQKNLRTFSIVLIFLTLVIAGYIIGETVFKEQPTENIERALKDLEAQKKGLEAEKRKAAEEAAKASKLAEKNKQEAEILKKQAEEAKKLVEQYKLESDKAAEEVERYQQARKEEETRLNEIKTKTEELSELANKKQSEASAAEEYARKQRSLADEAQEIASERLQASQTAREQAELEAARLRQKAEDAAAEAARKQAEAEAAVTKLDEERASSQRETQRALKELERMRSLREAEVKKVEKLQGAAEKAAKKVTESKVTKSEVTPEELKAKAEAKAAIEAERKRVERIKQKLEEDRRRIEALKIEQQKEAERIERERKAREEAARAAAQLREQEIAEEKEREEAREKRRKFPKQGKRR